MERVKLVFNNLKDKIKKIYDIIKARFNNILDKLKEKINFKDKRVYVPLIVIGVILAILLLLGIANFVSNLSNSKEEKFSSTAKEVEFIDELIDDVKEVGLKLSSEHSNCVNNICVENVKAMCYGDRGVIYFTVKNNSTSYSEGYLNLTVGDYSAVIWYDRIGPNESYNSFHSYDGYNFSCDDSSNYYVKAIDDDDKTAITTFKYYACLANRNYYEVDYENKRIINDGDEDYVTTACIYRSDEEKKPTSVKTYYDPCEFLNVEGETEEPEKESKLSPESNICTIVEETIGDEENEQTIEREVCFPACEDILANS